MAAVFNDRVSLASQLVSHSYREEMPVKESSVARLLILTSKSM
jgi:hypothetical protein